MPQPFNPDQFKAQMLNLKLQKQLNMAIYQTAQQIMQQHIFLTDPHTDTIYAYDTGVYTPNGDKVIKKWVETTLHEIYNTHYGNEVTAHIFNTTIKLQDLPEPPLNLICVANGLLNLDSQQLEQPTPQHYFFTKIPINYDPKAECPKWQTFISEVVDSTEDQALLQEMSGYCLHRAYPTAKGFMLYGKGNNGKTTFLKILEKVLGKNNVCHVPLHKLNKDRFATAQLNKKLANIFPEISDKEVTDLSIFKAATGGDTLYGEHKFKNPFPFTNHAKQIFSANKIPRIDSENDNLATWRRWQLIQFPNDFSSRENKKLDRELSEELPGILNWALQGLARLQSNDWTFSGETNAETTRAQYMEQSDSIGTFCNVDLMVDPESEVSKKLLYSLYTNFCRKRKYVVETDNLFFRRIPEFYTITEWQHKDENGIRERYVRGVKLTQETRDTRDFYTTKVSNSNSNVKVKKNGVYVVNPVQLPTFSSFNEPFNQPHGQVEGIPSKCVLCGIERCFYQHKVTFKLYCPNCAESVEKGRAVAK